MENTRASPPIFSISDVGMPNSNEEDEDVVLDLPPGGYGIPAPPSRAPTRNQAREHVESLWNGYDRASIFNSAFDQRDWSFIAAHETHGLPVNPNILNFEPLEPPYYRAPLTPSILSETVPPSNSAIPPSRKVIEEYSPPNSAGSTQCSSPALGKVPLSTAALPPKYQKISDNLYSHSDWSSLSSFESKSKKYRCAMCPTRFTDPSFLEEHMKWHELAKTGTTPETGHQPDPPPKSKSPGRNSPIREDVDLGDMRKEARMPQCANCGRMHSQEQRGLEEELCAACKSHVKADTNPQSQVTNHHTPIYTPSMRASIATEPTSREQDASPAQPNLRFPSIPASDHGLIETPTAERPPAPLQDSLERLKSPKPSENEAFQSFAMLRNARGRVLTIQSDVTSRTIISASGSSRSFPRRNVISHSSRSTGAKSLSGTAIKFGGQRSSLGVTASNNQGKPREGDGNLTNVGATRPVQIR